MMVMSFNTWSNVGVPAGTIDVVNINFLNESIELVHVIVALFGNVCTEFNHGVVTFGILDVIMELLTDERSPVELSDGSWHSVVGPVGDAVSYNHTFEVNGISISDIVLVVLVDLHREVWNIDATV